MGRLISILIFTYVFPLSVSAQTVVAGQPRLYSHEFVAKICSIDTVTLVSQQYLNNSAMPADNFKASLVRIQIVTKVKGKFKSRPCNILIELKEGDHSCKYDFIVGRSYRVFAQVARYTSDDILKKYRQEYFQLDCYNRPVAL